MPFVLKSSREYLLLVSDHRLIGSRMDWINSPRSGRRCRRSSRSSWSSSTHSSLRFRAKPWRRTDQTDRDQLQRELRRLSGRLAELEVERATAAREPIDLPPLPRTSELN